MSVTIPESAVTLDRNTQTLKDNVALLTPELLDQINQRIVQGGHVLVKKKAGQALRGRCDSFVVETAVHFPTDISLLFDAMRKVITLQCAVVPAAGQERLAPTRLQRAPPQMPHAHGTEQKAQQSQIA
jgi:hypothetical protein